MQNARWQIAGCCSRSSADSYVRVAALYDVHANLAALDAVLAEAGETGVNAIVVGGDLVWGFNFYRNSPAHGETSNWSPRYSSVNSVVSRFNDLHLPAPARVHPPPAVAVG